MPGRSHSVTTVTGAGLDVVYWVTVHADAKNGRIECPGCHHEELAFFFS